jgi:hypothetical protein
MNKRHKCGGAILGRAKTGRESYSHSLTCRWFERGFNMTECHAPFVG